jgi:hypothetical protein
MIIRLRRLLVRRPFEADEEELAANLEDFVDVSFADLQSSFLVLPKGPHFIEYARFREGYEVLKRSTGAFRDFDSGTVWRAMQEDSLVFVVLRTILGVTSVEWATIATTDRDIDVPQGAARGFDKSCRVNKKYIANLKPKRSSTTIERLEAMVDTACQYLHDGAPAGAADTVHRLAKVDTAEGLDSLQRVADLDVPYLALLYERYLGRPFATHRDAVSELVGDAMEGAIESRLHKAHISARKTGRAERVPGFDQAPDFIIPDEITPEVIIEAKITNDDGTARDKVARILRLAELGRRRAAQEGMGFQVVACIDGRGFGVRRQDIRDLLTELSGKVFTLRTLDQLVTHTYLSKYVSKP